MRSEEYALDVSGRGFIDVTDRVEAFVAGAGDGLVNVFAPHATAGLALMETGSGSETDLESILDSLLPRDRDYVHRHGSPGHGADHLLPAFLAPSLIVPVIGGRLQLGTWQRIVFVDLNVDNSRRMLRCSFVEG
ncbi:MAG: secondary thiamine-phosphate synthase enzyme YjbQ [Actinomycetota bacterium]|nr:secondary thiamine-phosphate synthase enzyme YjbQ [Actinomycetota bacterium]